MHSPERVLENEVRAHVNSKGEKNSTGGSMEGRTVDAASRRTARSTYNQLSYSSLLCVSWGRISQGIIFLDSLKCCHNVIEAADQTYCSSQSQQSVTRMASPSSHCRPPGDWQRSQLSTTSLVTWSGSVSCNSM